MILQRFNQIFKLFLQFLKCSAVISLYIGDLHCFEDRHFGWPFFDLLELLKAYAGFSLGVLPAQKLAQTRPGARGALLFYSCVPASEFGAAWPDGVAVQVHGMDADPIFVGEGDVDAARALVAEAEDAELFLYPGDRHIFADSSLSSYDADAAALLVRRVLDFLDAR